MAKESDLLLANNSTQMKITAKNQNNQSLVTAKGLMVFGQSEKGLHTAALEVCGVQSFFRLAEDHQALGGDKTLVVLILCRNFHCVLSFCEKKVGFFGHLLENILLGFNSG